MINIQICLRKIAEGTFICGVTGAIIYTSFNGEDHSHLPHQAFDTSPIEGNITFGTSAVSGTTIGTSEVSYVIYNDQILGTVQNPPKNLGTSNQIYSFTPFQI